MREAPKPPLLPAEAVMFIGLIAVLGTLWIGIKAMPEDPPDVRTIRVGYMCVAGRCP